MATRWNFANGKWKMYMRFWKDIQIQVVANWSKWAHGKHGFGSVCILTFYIVSKDFQSTKERKNSIHTELPPCGFDCCLFAVFHRLLTISKQTTTTTLRNRIQIASTQHTAHRLNDIGWCNRHKSHSVIHIHRLR